MYVMGGGQPLNKKAFTLIELLAVIVILAIIALIATPIILNIINDSKEKKKKRSAENYFDAVELAVANKNTKGKFNPDTCDMTGNIGECTGEFDVVHCNNDNEETACTTADLEVKVDGEIPTSGTIIFENGSVAAGTTLFYGNLKMFLGENNKITTTPIKPQNLYVDEAGVKINLPKGLTPVVYEDYKWKIASVEDAWYDYNNQKWANAVILEDGVSNKVGTKIYPSGDNTNIKAMFVYIPRYEYKIEGTYGIHSDGTIGTKNLPGEVKVNFIPKTQTVASSDYIISPAFDFGGQQLDGIWVGKFEVSHSDPTKSTTSLNCESEMCNEGDNLRILPDVQALTQNTISNLFYWIRSMSRKGNAFGISGDSHLMKNSEWAAVAYLSQSKYGKYGNNNYTGANKEVYINNSKKVYTGRSGGGPSGTTKINLTYKDQTSTITYNDYGFYTYDGYLLNYNSNTKSEVKNLTSVASTTGNITGIYDMSGGCHEYIMGNYNNTNNSSSGFNSLPENKYYDVYTNYGSNVKGHALEEISTSNSIYNNTAWYNSGNEFIDESWMWILRSGAYDISSSSLFYFGSGSGDGNNGNWDNVFSTRVVLVSN